MPPENKKAESKPKRKLLTPAERVAKLEQELREAREAAANKDRKRRDELNTQLTRLKERRAEVTTKINKVEAELKTVEEQLAADTAMVDGNVTPIDKQAKAG